MMFCGADKLYHTLKQFYFWRTLRVDCRLVVEASAEIRRDRAVFPLERYLFPTFKGFRPFTIWAIDLVGPLPKRPAGETYVVVCVDAFTKWVEIRVLSDKLSTSLTDFFYEDIIARYGVPVAVRSDRGTEFKGAFDRLCDLFSIRHYTTAPYHPRANGQVERINRSVKEMLRRALDSTPGSAWWEWIPDIAVVLRMTNARSHGYSPYYLVYKS